MKIGIGNKEHKKSCFNCILIFETDKKNTNIWQQQIRYQIYNNKIETFFFIKQAFSWMHKLYNFYKILKIDNLCTNNIKKCMINHLQTIMYYKFVNVKNHINNSFLLIKNVTFLYYRYRI